MLRRTIPALILAAVAAALPGGARAQASGCADPSGAVEAATAFSALSPAESELAEERFGAEFAEARARGRDPGALFAFARCELNGIAPPELVAVGRAPATCAGTGAGGPCGLWVLSRTEEGWLQILETVGAPRLAASSTRGWTDILAGAGPRPTVFKFDGDVYASDLGDDAVTLDGLEEYGAALDGALQVVWFGLGDDIPEAAGRVFLWFWEHAAVTEDGGLQALPDEFRVGLAPIIPDAAPAVAIQGTSARFCSAEGCAHWIYRPSGDSAAPRLAAKFRAFDLNLADSGAFGHRDLVVNGIAGPQVWRHDGTGYVHSPVTRPVRPGEAAALED
ncbi:hypothetical protein ACQ5SO_10945 [Rhodovulum sp. DZ06]|uniref:hypothetical protein n=1 Tax=Rhodovulum sp. DZ06 TaxID=3425126 RepID=UPI003D352E6A